MLAESLTDPGHYCVIAERGGAIVGGNFLDERSFIVGVGPVTVAPDGQNTGVGRRLMEHVMQRAAERGAVGVRLVQAAYHCGSRSPCP